MTLRKQNGSWVRTLYIAPSLVSVFTGGRPAGRVCLSVVVVLGLSVRRRRRVGSVCRRVGSVCRCRRVGSVCRRRAGCLSSSCRVCLSSSCPSVCRAGSVCRRRAGSVCRRRRAGSVCRRRAGSVCRRRVGSVCRRRAGSVCRRRRTVTVTLATDTSVGIRRAVSVPQTPPCQLQRR